MTTNHQPFVRQYRDGDRADLVALWETCFPNDPRWNDPVLIINRKLTLQPELFFVYEADARVVGSVLAGYDGFRGWINKLATHPLYQGQGIASALLKTAETALAELGCPKVNLQVRMENAQVVELYQLAGYETESLISMGKLLTPNPKQSAEQATSEPSPVDADTVSLIQLGSSYASGGAIK